MAKISDNYKEITDFLVSYQNQLELTEESEEYGRQIERYQKRLQQGDTHVLECYTSVINTMQGVMIMDREHSECVLAAYCERAVRDFLRCMPVHKELTCYIDRVFYSVAAEFLYSRNPGESRYCIKGLRVAELSDLNRSSEKKLDKVIPSKKDDVVSEFKQYTVLKSRIETGHVVMEGMLMVKRALEDNLQVEKVVYSDGIDAGSLNEIAALCKKSNAPYYRTTPGIMAAMTTTNPVPEIMCSVRIKVCDQKDLIITENRNFFLVLDGISNPDNLGMVLRTADASGVNGVILLSNSTHPYNKNAIRGARGAVGRIPIYFCTDDFELMDILHEHHFKIMGTSARFQSANLYDIQYDSDNIAVVIGNESNGVRKEILDRCTDYVKIPMAEGQSSLNIAVAAALLLYEYDRVIYRW